MRKYYNLSSSQFIDYLGFNKYIKGRGSHGKRNTRLQMDILGEKPEISSFALPFVEYGRNMEIKALKSYADFRGKKGKDFYFILDNQKSFELHDFAQKDKGIVSLSSTPDAVTDCFKVVCEAKCPKMGEDIYSLEDIKSKYTTQIFGQQYVLDRLGYAPEKTHFINWCPHKFQVYEIERNPEYEEYLEQRLMEYAFNLLSEQEFTEKTEEFVVEDKLFNLIHEVDNGTKER